MYMYGFRTFFIFSHLFLSLCWNCCGTSICLRICSCVPVWWRERKKWVLPLPGGGEISGNSGDLLWSLNPALEEIPLPRFTSPFAGWQFCQCRGAQSSFLERERPHLKCNAGIPAGQALSCMLPLQRGRLERVVMVWCVHSNLCY